jgi:hypothetical protein
MFARTIGSIVTRDGDRVPLTSSDLLWAARMLVGESTSAARARDAEAAAILWTMATRLMRRRQSGNHDLRSFTEMIRGRPGANVPGYSQPIAWQWSRTGWCAPGGRHAGEPACSEDRLRRRESVSRMQWSDIEAAAPGLKAFVHAWARGEIANPVPRAVHFAQVGHNQPAGAILPDVSPRSRPSNWFGPDQISAQWRADYVYIIANGGGGSVLPWLFGLGALLIGVGLGMSRDD